MSSELPINFRFGVRSGESDLNGEGGRGFAYWNDELNFGATVWPTSWLGVDATLSARHTSSTEATLGSRKVLGILELAPRFRAPVKFLDHVYISPDVHAGIGRSWLNFGGGDNPKGASDSLWGYGGRMGFIAAITDDIGMDIFAGAAKDKSPSRNYDEESFFAGVSLMLGRQPEFQSLR